jgi:hypothetical protein
MGSLVHIRYCLNSVQDYRSQQDGIHRQNVGIRERQNGSVAKDKKIKKGVVVEPAP